MDCTKEETHGGLDCTGEGTRGGMTVYWEGIHGGMGIHGVSTVGGDTRKDDYTQGTGCTLRGNAQRGDCTVGKRCRDCHFLAHAL